MGKNKIGYVIVSNDIMKAGNDVTYAYRQDPDNDQDSGWRFFSGHESQSYVNNACNFAMYNATSIIEIDESLIDWLMLAAPIEIEKDDITQKWIVVEEGNT